MTQPNQTYPQRMRMAYADPPYLGCCRLYGHEHRNTGCWDEVTTHRHLILMLMEDYPDGWALSASSVSLRALLPLCPSDVRVAAWVKPFHIFKKGVRPAYAWEPVIFRGGRNKGHQPPEKGAEATTPRDWVSANITLRRGLVGAKPAEFSFWLFNLLGMHGSDEFVDLFPGSGVVTDAWNTWSPLILNGRRIA